MKKNKIAFLLCLLGALAALVHFSGQDFSVHHLDKALLFPNDAFGRNLIFWVMDLAFETGVRVTSLCLICLGLSVILAELATRPQPRFRFLIRTVLDTASSLPTLLLALSLSAYFPNSNWIMPGTAVFLVLPWLIRFFESRLLSLRKDAFVHASLAMGAKSRHVFQFHLWPGLSSSVRLIFPTLIARLILIECTLSFLGLHANARFETWGSLLYQGRDYMIEAPWILLFAALPLCAILYLLQMLGAKKCA